MFLVAHEVKEARLCCFFNLFCEELFRKGSEAPHEVNCPRERKRVDRSGKKCRCCRRSFRQKATSDEESKIARETLVHALAGLVAVASHSSEDFEDLFCGELLYEEKHKRVV